MKNKNKLTCKTGLRKNVIGKGIFEKEIALCSKLNQENNGKCGWGECDNCGVIPILIKLHKGQLLEDPAEIKRAREQVFNKTR